jgi:hypothetical protein
VAARRKARAGASRDGEVVITASSLDRILHAVLRAEAEAALARGEQVALVTGRGEGAAVVETLVLSTGRAAQTAGGYVHRGTFSGGRLHTDTGCHALDRDGACFCRDCEMAGGHCVDDDE